MARDYPLIPVSPYGSGAVELPVRKAGDRGGPEYVVKASLLAETKNGVVLSGATVSGLPVRVAVSIVAKGVVHVVLQGDLIDPKRVTLARDQTEFAAPVRLEHKPGQIMLACDDLAVQITLDPFHITYLRPNGAVLLDQNYEEKTMRNMLSILPFGFTQMDGRLQAFHETFTAEPDEHFYGFGEQFGEFDKRGQRVEMWMWNALGVHGERAYKNVPFFVSTRGYGIFVDSVTCINFDVLAANNGCVQLIVPDTALDYYVIFGPELKTVINRYSKLVSLPIRPPKWSLGFWMSSCFVEGEMDSTEQTLKRARALREHNIPCDVLHLDAYWQRPGHWCDLIWDASRFPDPPALLKQVHEMGYRVCLWMNSYLSSESDRFREAAAKGYLLKGPDGQPYAGSLWDASRHPPTGIIDFTNPEAVEWLKDLLRPLLRMGADVFKTDFGESVWTDAIAHNGMTGGKLHNLYPLLYNDAVAEVTREVTGGPGLVWGRSTYAGGQRHAAQWAGDPLCTYGALAATLRSGLSMAMSGHPFWSHDIGGFKGRPTPDLYIRWAQFGLFSPFSRAHGTTSRLPWDYGEEAERIVRDFVRLRYRLLPYIYSYSRVAASTGLPVMRPMVLEFPDDPATYSLDLQYMFGAELLAAPIYNNSGVRPVYFPSGQWIDYWTHEIIEGPQTRWATAPLDTMPLYVRGGALIPTMEPPQYIADEKPWPLVTLDAYIMRGGSFALHDSDGVTYVSVWLDGSHLNVQVNGPKKQLGLRLIALPGVPVVDTVLVKGETLARVQSLEGVTAGWVRDADGTVRALISVP